MTNIDFGDFIEKTNNATSAVSAFKILEDALSSIGIDKVLYSLMTDFPDLGQNAGHGIFRNYPESWMSYYVENDYENTDPVRQYLVQYDNTFLWDDLNKRMPLNKKQKLLMNQAREAGLTTGVGLGIHCPNYSVVGMGFASTEKIAISPNQLSMIRALSQQFHTVYTSLHLLDQKEFVTLSQREKDILSWIAEGKTNWEISQILGITPRSVKQSRERIYKKLNCNNAILAVTKALSQNLITPVRVRYNQQN